MVGPRDRELIADWLVEFMAEARLRRRRSPDPGAAADRWVAQVGRIGYVWEDGGSVVVSLVGAGGETPHGIRIGPVYTPPERRSRGYACSLTAAASQDQLDGAGSSSSCSPISPTRPRTRSTRPSATSRSATSTSTASAPMRRAAVAAAAPCRMLRRRSARTDPAAARSGWMSSRWSPSARGADEQPLPIDCMHQIANRRVRVGFTCPLARAATSSAASSSSSRPMRSRSPSSAAVDDDPPPAHAPTSRRGRHRGRPGGAGRRPAPARWERRRGIAERTLGLRSVRMSKNRYRASPEPDSASPSRRH